MNKILRCTAIFSLLCCFVLLFSGCATEEKKKAPQGRFMENEQHTEVPRKNFFQERREREERYKRGFTDMRRPIDQDTIQVMPWRNDASNRSESMLEDGRAGKSIFSF